jgi:hypothetical protein
MQVKINHPSAAVTRIRARMGAAALTPPVKSLATP